MKAEVVGAALALGNRNLFASILNSNMDDAPQYYCNMRSVVMDCGRRSLVDGVGVGEGVWRYRSRSRHGGEAGIRDGRRWRFVMSETVHIIMQPV